MRAQQLPRIIFSLSDFYKNKFNEFYSKYNVTIKKLGKTSTKKRIHKCIKFNKNKIINIILCPEGTFDDIVYFINFANINLNFTNLKIYLSIHPLINKKKIMQYLNNNATNKINILSISTKLQPTNTFSLYSGSSTVIKHIAKGFIPLYLDRSFDEANPLSDFISYIPKITPTSKFSVFLENFHKKFVNNKYLYQSELFKISQLIEPLDKNLLNKIFN